MVFEKFQIAIALLLAIVVVAISAEPNARLDISGYVMEAFVPMLPILMPNYDPPRDL